MAMDFKRENPIAAEKEDALYIATSDSPGQPLAEQCPDCGMPVYRSGGCPVCISCGWSKCM